MRQITKESINAFMSGKEFKKTNIKYHNNAIAYKYNDPKNTISITNSGWLTNTTKERLNGIPNVSIQQKNFVWYLNGVKWDGKLIDIK